MYDAISIEERNTPTVTLVNVGFTNDAWSAKSGKGMPGARYVATSVPCESSIMEEVEAGITDAFDDIITALTGVLSDEEKSPKPREIEKPSRIAFKGSLEEVNRFFYKRGWTDGLPIIPPTEEAVSEMLTGTDLPPDHLVTKLIPRLGKATVEKIAINAVMAGALPTYMPLLIAGVQILTDSTSGFGGWGVSTGSWAPFWVINGPIRKQLHLNSGSGVLSPGDIANAAIGRAMGLITKNIGGIRKGVEDMGVQGNPGKYSMVLAENEEESPWEPLHVEMGYNREDSTISVSSPNTYLQIWPYASDDEGILRGIIYNLIPKRGLYIILTPPHAKTLARSGWSKQDIKKFIAEYARFPAHRLPYYWGTSFPAYAGSRPGLHKDRIPFRESDSVSVFRDQNSIAVLVGGGPGAMIGLHMGGGFFPHRKMSEKVNFPANWDKLVAKYKNVVPTYVRY
ncbi:hypothetical protein ACFL7M_10220 [Thermodesulfobacteriota bacterium]